jgi:hypothetical protein
MITLQFCSFDCWQNRLIRWFSAGRVGHVDVVMPDGSLLGAQHDAGMGGRPAGVWVRSAIYGDQWGMRNRIRVSLPATREQERMFYAFLRRQIGKPYDSKAIWGFVFARNWRDSRAWFCSELAAAALEYAGVVRPFGAPNKITPQELLLVCSALGTVDYIDAKETP